MTSLCPSKFVLLLLAVWTFAVVLAQTGRNNARGSYTRHSQANMNGRKQRVSSWRSDQPSRSRSSSSQNSRGYLDPNQWSKNRGSLSYGATSRGSKGGGRSSSQRSRSQSSRRRSLRSSKPNIVVILTDDQDVLLGSLHYMPKVRRLLTNQGVYFNNSFVSTPMCCPSRSSFLTGLYVHNHNVYTNNQNCSSLSWMKTYESRSFATYVNETYNTGYFGKYLNEYYGNHVPPGWHRWVGLIRNSRFYNYTVVNERGDKMDHQDNYYTDYLTDLVGNDSIAFLHDSLRRQPTKPVMMVLSVPAPHGPEDAAPQYQHMFVNNTDHRTPAWNFAPNKDKQWLLQNTVPMMPQFKKFTDLLQRRRLQTLQSVDDMVEKVVEELDSIGELSNTYIIYTSDHGYHLGQYGLIKGKAMPFDFDVRVPLIMRGPGIRQGSVISNVVNNIDLAPTLIDMAGHQPPDHMDGQSMVRLLKASKDPNNVDRDGFVTLKRPWKDTVLLERGKLSDKIMRQRMRTEELNYYATGTKQQGKYFFGSERKRRLLMECSNGDKKWPCKPGQKWYCIEDNGHLKKHKCRRHGGGVTSTLQRDQVSGAQACACTNSRLLHGLNRRERRKHRRALRQAHKSGRFPKYRRRRRSTHDLSAVTLNPGGQAMPFPQMFEPRLDVRCRILSNSSVQCDHDIYHKPLELEHHRETINDMIKEYKKALQDLKYIRRHLLDQESPIDKEMLTDPSAGEEGKDCLCDEQGNLIEVLQKRRKRRQRNRPTGKRRGRKRRKSRHPVCKVEHMNCFTHDNDHWKTPPYWNYGPFCFCSNANNNTYWCLRTINQTHDFLYCEFITLFMSYYDLRTDPFQLKNIVTEINYGVLQQLHDELDALKKCKGPKQCNIVGKAQAPLPNSTQDWEGLTHLRRQSKSRREYHDDYTQGLWEGEEEIDDDFDPNWSDSMGGRYTLKQAPDYE